MTAVNINKHKFKNLLFRYFLILFLPPSISSFAILLANLVVFLERSFKCFVIMDYYFFFCVILEVFLFLPMTNLVVFLQNLKDSSSHASLPSPGRVVDGDRVAGVGDRVVRVARVRVVVVVCVRHRGLVRRVC